MQYQDIEPTRINNNAIPNSVVINKLRMFYKSNYLRILLGFIERMIFLIQGRKHQMQF